jgi:hypothetical protein
MRSHIKKLASEDKLRVLVTIELFIEYIEQLKQKY